MRQKVKGPLPAVGKQENSGVNAAWLPLVASGTEKGPMSTGVPDNMRRRGREGNRLFPWPTKCILVS